jgi:UPF0755 protein
MRRLVLIAIFLAVAAIVAVQLMWRMPGPLEQDANVVIPRGSSLTAAAETLESQTVVVSALRFRILARFLGGGDPIKAGEFLIPAGSSAASVLDILQHGQPIQRSIIIPEGMPSIMVYERLMAEPLLTGTIEVPAEGSVLPASYNFERGEARAAVLKRMQDAMTRTLAELWAARKPTTVVETPEEAVILASIVEKETAKPSERRMIAGVYSNRLKLGMKLDADPTVIYPVTKGKALGRRILRSELEDDNGYNTYVRAGLPIGPIANPGRESIAAVLDPAETKALYFVADGTGGHVFADTLDEQNQNVAKWFEIRRKRGEL